MPALFNNDYPVTTSSNEEADAIKSVLTQISLTVIFITSWIKLQPPKELQKGVVVFNMLLRPLLIGFGGGNNANAFITLFRNAMSTWYKKVSTI